MFCTSCGQTINEGSAQCPNCGATVGTARLTPDKPFPPVSPESLGSGADDSLRTVISPSGEFPRASSPENNATSDGPKGEFGQGAAGRAQTGISPGRVLGGRYQLDEFIASGGMGDIYRARRLHIGDTVAVKVLRPEVIDNQQTRQRFYREARAAAMLHHPNAVVIHDFGEDNDGTTYIVMELLDGQSLRQLLVAQGTVPSDRTYVVLRQACAALEAAHRSGIVHRDIKPDNIMLLDTHGGEDHVKLLDFGIAKLRDHALDTLSLEKNLTNVGTVIGTPHYMSPEQCQGEPADARSDIYSLGVVAYEMLTGVTPFIAKTPTGVAIKHVTEPPKPPTEIRADINPAIEAVVLRALAKDPEARQPSALEFSREFAAALSGTSSLPADATQIDQPAGTQVFVPQSTGENPQLQSFTTVPFSATGEQNKVPGEGDANADDSGAAPPGGYETQVASINATEVLKSPTAPVKQPTSSVRPPTSQMPPSTPATGLLGASPSTGHLAEQQKKTSAISAPGSSAAARKPGIPVTLIAAAAAGVVVIAIAGWWIMGRLGRESAEPAATPAPVPSAAASPEAPAVPTAPVGMVYIEGGEFQMGRESGEIDEKPIHTVTVGPFFLDITEVTKEQYQSFVDATGYAPPPVWGGQRYPEGEANLPVTDVTWVDANAFARWAGKRLPTEEEWEFAARGVEGLLYPWGNEALPDRGNVTIRPGENRRIEPVGQYVDGASPFKVLDLIGNVWEWTASDYAAYPGGKVAELDPGFRTLKVIRGGYFGNDLKKISTTTRRGWPATRVDWPSGVTPEYVNTGFRCAQDVSR